MEKLSIIHSDWNERSITFKFTNTTDTNKEVYIKDITLYSFLRNIDWVNNVFSWIELRSISLDKLVYNPPDDGIIDTIEVPVLCCLRIPPGNYKNTESIIAVISENLEKLNNDGYGIAISHIQAVHNVPACAYDIGELAIQENAENKNPWYPAIINSHIIFNNFDISLTNDDVNVITPEESYCVPVLEWTEDTKELSVPLEGTLAYNNLALYNSDVISKLGSNSLTSHAITFVNGITDALNIDNITININDLYTSDIGLIRHRENGNNYTEFIINPSNTELINEVNSKYNAMKINTKNYPELNEDNEYKMFNCVGYPFFPISTKLYIYNCNTPYVDKIVESQLSTDRLFGISLASMDVESEWSSSSADGYETLDNKTSVRAHTVSVDAVINIPSGSATSIYVTGDNQRYPLWRASHMLTYRVIN